MAITFTDPENPGAQAPQRKTDILTGIVMFLSSIFQHLLDTDLKNTSCHNELDEYVSDNLYSQENQDDHG